VPNKLVGIFGGNCRRCRWKAGEDASMCGSCFNPIVQRSYGKPITFWLSSKNRSMLHDMQELLQVSNFNLREGKELLLQHVIQSYRDTAVGATFKFEKLELVHNDQLSHEILSWKIPEWLL